MKKYWLQSLVKEQCNVMKSGNVTEYECTEKKREKASQKKNTSLIKR